MFAHSSQGVDFHVKLFERGDFNLVWVVFIGRLAPGTQLSVDIIFWDERFVLGVPRQLLVSVVHFKQTTSLLVNNYYWLPLAMQGQRSMCKPRTANLTESAQQQLIHGIWEPVLVQDLNVCVCVWVNARWGDKFQLSTISNEKLIHTVIWRFSLLNLMKQRELTRTRNISQCTKHWSV